MGVRSISGGVSTIPLHVRSVEASSAKGKGSSSNTIKIQGGNVDGDDGLTQPSESKRPKTNGCRVKKPHQGSGEPRGAIASVGGAAGGESVGDASVSDASTGVGAVVTVPARGSEEGSRAGGVDGCLLGDKRKRSDDMGDVIPGGYDGAFEGAEEGDEGKRRRVEGSLRKRGGDGALDNGLGASGQRTANSSSRGGDSCINME